MDEIISTSPYAYLDGLTPAERQSAIHLRQHERREEWCDAARRARDYQADAAVLEQACVENAECYESMLVDLRARITELEAALQKITKIELSYLSHEWAEIEQAQDIASSALRNR